jgi:hypothetical protein
MLIPLEKRWMPPQEVIAAFEREGFAWGGKWDFFDNMHFEFRPELFEMKKVLSALGGDGAEPTTILGIGSGAPAMDR